MSVRRPERISTAVFIAFQELLWCWIEVAWRHFTAVATKRLFLEAPPRALAMMLHVRHAHCCLAASPAQVDPVHPSTIARFDKILSARQFEADLQACSRAAPLQQQVDLAPAVHTRPRKLHREIQVRLSAPVIRFLLTSLIY